VVVDPPLEQRDLKQHEQPGDHQQVHEGVPDSGAGSEDLAPYDD
jgi:hypothetical protein